MAAFPIELFEAALPAALRPLIAAAKKGEGELAWLLNDAQRRGSSEVQRMLRRDPPHPPEIAGWAAGIAMFDSDASFVMYVLGAYAGAAPVPFVLQALGAGIAAGVECPIATWKCFETLLRETEPPEVLLKAMPIGLVSTSAIVRKSALGVLLRRPHEALPIVEDAAKKKLSAAHAKRLREALAALGPSPALVARDKDGLLQRLLDEWGKTFDERLMAPIAAAGAAEAAKRGALKAASKGELERAWIDLAKNKDPGDVDRLLSTPWPGAWKLALERVQALAPFPRDPRIATAVTEQARRYTSWAGRAVGTAAAQVASNMRQPQLGAASPALLSEVTRLTPHRADLESLWKAFWENPRDEGRRVVLADALQTAGDPRGEFISLQLAMESGTADASAQKRANALLDQHIDTWSGGLPGVQLASREFRRGFLTALKLRPDGKHLEKALDRNEWKTVERLGVDYVSIHARQVGALMKRMPCLRVLLFNQSVHQSVLQDFGGTFPGVELIGADDFFPVKRPEAFPSLQMICVYAEPLRALEAAKRAGLRGVMLRSATDLKKALVAFEKPSVQAVSELRIAASMYGDCVPRGWMIRITRERPDQADLFHTGRYEKGSFAQWAALFAAHGRLKLRIHCPEPLKKKLEAEPFGEAELGWSHRPFDVFTIS